MSVRLWTKWLWVRIQLHDYPSLIISEIIDAERRGYLKV